MNKLWFILILGLFSPIFGERVPERFFSGKVIGLTYNDILERFLERDLKVLVDIDKTISIKVTNEISNKNPNKPPKIKVVTQKTNINCIELIFSDALQQFNISLNPIQRKDFLNAIQKYKEWNSIAIKNKQEIQKDIARVNSEYLYWRYQSSSEGYSSSSYYIVTRFLSQNIKHHQFLLHFPEAKSTYNSYITANPDTLYLEYEEVVKLEKLLTDKAVESAIKTEAEKNKKANELFQ